jgi:HAD superfamily hydrolase (TIGR01450 family)
MDYPNPSIQLLRDKKLFVFDMDGTIYRGGDIFDYAIRFIHNLRRAGKRVLFCTNNSSTSTETYVENLTRMGFAPTADEIMSSADATEAYLKTHHPGALIYLIGTEQMQKQFRERGFRLATGQEASVDVVVSSLDTELTYQKVKDGCRFIAAGATFLSTHPDINCPTDYGFMPDSGAIAALIISSTGVTPRYLGKPSAAMMALIEQRTGISRADACIFGDRLYTDIALGTRNGAASVLVLTGEGTLEEVAATPDEDKPTFVFPTVDEVDRAMFGSAMFG